jgi:hypothetical protein
MTEQSIPTAGAWQARSRASGVSRRFLGDVGNGMVVSGKLACRGQLAGTSGGLRSVASGAHSPKCSRMRWMTPGFSIKAMTRIGPLHWKVPWASNNALVSDACAAALRAFHGAPQRERYPAD